MTAIEIREAVWPADRDVVAWLIREYVDTLGVDLSFQQVEAELAELPGSYARPDGVVLVAGKAEGMVAYRSRGFETCEMKRLYVRRRSRGGSLGRRLSTALIADAHAHGYRRMVLDTLAPMASARRLYEALGFRPIPPYYDNPLPDAVFLALDL